MPAPRSGYRFATRPRWIAGHVLVLLAVAVMANLGFWQLRRLDERRAANERVERRSAAPPATLAEIADLAASDAGAAEFRRVRATGSFLASHEVLVGYRTSRGLPGYHVITPFTTGGGTVLVNRGFVPLAMAERWPVADAAPPAGQVEMAGLVRRSGDARASSIDDVGGEVPTLDAVDVDVIGRALGRPVLPVYVELQQPRAPGFPEALPPLDLGEGPHLSYAVQWFCFATVAAAGWLFVLRRQAQRPSVGGGAAPPESAAAVADSSAAAR